METGVPMEPAKKIRSACRFHEALFDVTIEVGFKLVESIRRPVSEEGDTTTIGGAAMAKKSTVAESNTGRSRAQVTDLYPPTHLAGIEIVLSGVAWVFAVMWLNVAGGAELSLGLVIVMEILVISFTLLLTTASKAINDPGWRPFRGSRLHCPIYCSDVAR
jgi:hypothetical protein